MCETLANYFITFVIFIDRNRFVNRIQSNSKFKINKNKFQVVTEVKEK